MGEESISFNSYDDFKKYLDDYEKQTMTHFITIKKEKKFSESDYKGKCIHWSDCPDQKSSTPFVNVGQLLLGCHQGRDKNVGKKEKYRQQVAEKLKNSDKKVISRFRTHATKKLDCPAAISLKKIALFPGFKEDISSSPWTKRKTVVEIQHFVKEDKQIEVIFKFVAKFPAAGAHKYHVQGEFAGLREPVDPLVRKKVTELVKGGLTKVLDIKKALHTYVVKDLFPNQTPPSMIRRRYYPSTNDIKNMIYLARSKLNLQKGCDDGTEVEESLVEVEGSLVKLEEPLVELIAKSLEDNSEKESFVIARNESGSLISKEDINNKSVLFCHQTREQQRLLSIYGSMIVMDIVDRSSGLAADVVFLYVRTNVDFQLVAGFVGDAGTPEAVKEGFHVLKDWNPDWTPEFFVMDHHVEMMDMIKRIFSGCEVFVSDFHREKICKTWFATQEPDMDQALCDKTLDMIRKMARAPTRDQYEGLLKAFIHGCEGWVSSVKLQSWFATVWDAKSWVTAFQPDKLCILLSAMNGLDKLHDALKVGYFEDLSIETLYDVIQHYKDIVVPQFYQRYLENNIRCSSSYGKLNKALPVYLKDRPLDLINHVMARSPVPSALTDNVMQLENGTYTVLNEKGQHHSVCLGNEDVFPSCTCGDWLQHWLPCKHFLAVFHHLGDQTSWQQLSALYSNNPIFSLDDECILQHMASPSEQVVNGISVKQHRSGRKRKDTMPEKSKSSKVETTNQAKCRRSKRHKSQETPKASDKTDATEDGCDTEENHAAYQLLAQMASAQTDGTTSLTVAFPASSLAAADVAPASDDISIDKTSIVPVCVTEDIEAMSDNDASQAVDSSSQSKDSDDEETKEIECSNVSQEDCFRLLEQLSQVTPAITEPEVLHRVFRHLQSALKETGVQS